MFPNSYQPAAAERKCVSGGLSGCITEIISERTPLRKGRGREPPILVRQVVCLERSGASLLPLLPQRRRGRGEEAVFHQFPLSPALSPLVPRGERGKNALGVFHAEHNTIGETPAATPLNTYGDVSSRRTRAAPGIDRPALFRQFAKALALASLFDYSSSMRIGSLELKSNLILSPLAGYTNLPFRLTLREVGGLDLATTDLVNARSLLERNPKALKLIETCPADRPLAVQLFGSIPEEMRDAAQFLESNGVSSVDINMGCPVRKVCRVGGGSAMMTELDKTAKLVKGMVDTVKMPVTAKMRLGWDDQNITAPDLARA